MKPCTLHYVLTIGNSITHGFHFYSAGAVRLSCWGIIHCSVMNGGITNNEHPETVQLLRRMLHVVFISFQKAGQYCVPLPVHDLKFCVSDVSIWL